MSRPIDIELLAEKHPAVSELADSYDAACKRADDNAMKLWQAQSDLIDTTRRLEAAEARAAQLEASLREIASTTGHLDSHTAIKIIAYAGEVLNTVTK